MYVDYDDIAVSTAGYIGPISAPDTIPPSIPENLQAVAVSPSQINLTWTAATDIVGVAGYRIYRNGTYLANTSNTFYQDSGLSSSTTYSYRVSVYDAAGNEGEQSPSVSITTQASPGAQILFQEFFEDTNFASRGWYDITGGALSIAEHVNGSASSLECRFMQGGTGCAGGSPARHLFNETESVYLSYYVKYSGNYIGSGLSYGPHEFHFLTNKDHAYIGPAGTHLTMYIEQNGGTPRLALQDMLNVDTNCILRNDNSFVGCNGNFSTYNFTESRSVASCNGLTGPVDGRDCFQWDSAHWYSARYWDADSMYFANEPNQWHHVEVFFKMNSIQNGVGIADGQMRYWLDGRLLIDYSNILYRTAQNTDMGFNQFMIAPYIGDGSLVQQTMWIDNLSVATGRIGQAVCVHKSDQPPCDSCIEISELTLFIDRWEIDNMDVTIRELIEAIGLWKRGC